MKDAKNKAIEKRKYGTMTDVRKQPPGVKSYGKTRIGKGILAISTSGKPHHEVELSKYK